MKKNISKRTACSSNRPSALELAHLAVAVAHWKRSEKPAFIEAEEIIESARRHLAGDLQLHSFDDYEKAKARMGLVAPPEPTPLLTEVEAVVQTLLDDKPHPKVEEPPKYPTSYTSCIRLITGEKDPRRRAQWLAKANISEKKAEISNAFDYRILAAKLVPHLPRFGAVYPRRKKTASARDMSGKFTEAKTHRDAHGRVKKIIARDQLGRIARNPPSL